MGAGAGAGASVPQWLYSSFITAMQDVGATASDEALRAEADDVIGRWQDPDRHVHGLRHLINLLARIDELSPGVHDSDVLRVAAWYHGLVLNRAVSILLDGQSNQDTAGACGRVTSHRLEELGVSEDVVARITELIHYMARRTAPRDDVDAQVLVDADLATLASSPQDYKQFRLKLREEYPQLDDLVFLKARRRVVRRLLSRPSIFFSPMGAQWEGRARENLEAELARLDESISKLEPGTSVSEPIDLQDDEVVVNDGPLTGPDDGQLTSTGTLIIRRRKLKKNRRPDAADGEPEVWATGVLPVMRPDAGSDSAGSGAGEDGEDDADVDSSSLESAIDVLDARRAGPPAPAPARTAPVSDTPVPPDGPDPDYVAAHPVEEAAPAPAPAAPAPAQPSEPSDAPDVPVTAPTPVIDDPSGL